MFNLLVYFYPRSPCGERLFACPFFPKALKFLSTLSLRRATHLAKHPQHKLIFLSTLSLRRATAEIAKTSNADTKFLSTLSLRRATESIGTLRTVKVISIHALLAESDANLPRNQHQRKHISIHALLAESDIAPPSYKLRIYQFLSTLSLRRATLSMAAVC